MTPAKARPEHRRLIVGLSVAAALLALAVPRVVHALHTISTDDAYVNGYGLRDGRSLFRLHLASLRRKGEREAGYARLLLGTIEMQMLNIASRAEHRFLCSSSRSLSGGRIVIARSSVLRSFRFPTPADLVGGGEQ